MDSDLVDPAAFPDSPHIAPNHIESQTGRLLPYLTISEDGVTSAKHRFRQGQILYSKIRPYLAKAIVIFPGGTARAVAHTLQGYYASLHAHGSSAPWRERMLDFDALNQVIGTPELLALGQRYG